MTKQEKILKQQIKELERLIEIKDAVIIELKSLIRPNYYWPVSTTSSGTISISAVGAGDTVDVTSGTTAIDHTK